MGLKQALQTALDFEEKGQALYEQTVAKTFNPVVRKTFEYLALQEINHINEIKEFMMRENPDMELKGDKIEGVKRFFSMTIEEFKEKLEISEDDLAAHELALDLEQKSYDFYKEQLDQAPDEPTKRFFKFLMEQENAHYELIQKAYEFIKDPVSFQVDAEDWMFEGG